MLRLVLASALVGLFLAPVFVTSADPGHGPHGERQVSTQELAPLQPSWCEESVDSSLERPEGKTAGMPDPIG